MMSNSMVLASVVYLVMFVLATWGKYRLNARAFNRRNQFGIEQFDSYTDALLAKWGEGMLRFLCTCAQIGFLAWCVVFVNLIYSK